MACDNLFDNGYQSLIGTQFWFAMIWKSSSSMTGHRLEYELDKSALVQS